MGNKKTPLIPIIAIIVVLGATLLIVAANTSLLLMGDYYVKVDNAHIAKNESDGGVIHLKSNEPYIYQLEAINASGDKAEIEFGTSRELRQDAFLKLELQPIRGVVNWSEVSEDELPPVVAEALLFQ